MVIAGSPRNSFRTSLEVKDFGGRALDGLRSFGDLVQLNSECQNLYSGVRLWGLSSIVERETAHDRNLRSLNLQQFADPLFSLKAAEG